VDAARRLERTETRFWAGAKVFYKKVISPENTLQAANIAAYLGSGA